MFYSDGLYTIEYFFGLKDQYRVAPGFGIPVLWGYDSIETGDSKRRGPTDSAKEIAECLQTSIQDLLLEGGIVPKSYKVLRYVPWRNPSVSCLFKK